ncbi:iron ABC transporter permease [Advenella mimigardefordensis]|uniref:Putative iron(3+)-hydroxamate import system permease protein FhuB n=1 Tax=Advenella mimigardefordensis (strain DSM 17166 / LMG 22922 / DPN7) TaxID=1247726 RepID=W0PDX6_ADVMD|nr:iron ABC transporter permease [Advenella mimigardefordensis]AHG65074.1 putative iron(3+)-hydroxamate import system permease protein FhuB [Advenella mimigardefordensis DPN7]
MKYTFSARILALFSGAIAIALIAAVMIVAAPGHHAGSDAAMQQLVFWHGILPRIAMALLCGTCLGLSGFILQQVTQNTLAAPDTLAISSGAQFALLMGMMYFPQAQLFDSTLLAMIGSLVSSLLMLLFIRRAGSAGNTMILIGLMLTLLLTTLSNMYLILNPDQLYGLIIWGAGSLSQDSWGPALRTGWQTLLCLPLSWLLLPSLRAFALQGTLAKSVGVNVRLVRVTGFILVSFLIAIVVSSVGVIAFVGLAAPVIARSLGVTDIRKQWAYAMLFGALLLSITDSALQLATYRWPNSIMTGTVTALLGVPVLLLLLMKQRSHTRQEVAPLHAGLRLPGGQLRKRMLLLMALAIGCFVLLPHITHNVAGNWTLVAHIDPTIALFTENRTLTAILFGIAIACAGTLIQNMTNNSMASPEFLGVTSGTGLGLIGLMMLVPAPSPLLYLVCGIGGAFASLLFVMLINARNQFQPEKILLTGMALTQLFSSLLTLTLASGMQQVQQLLIWISGDTYMSLLQNDLPVRYGIVALLILLACVTRRPLSLLRLGDPVARATGQRPMLTRTLLFLLIAALTTLASITIGPTSFVGLIAPHLARSVGFHGLRTQMLASSLIAIVIMLCADLLGRHIMFPYEVPTGLIATFIGAVYFLWQFTRKQKV